MKKINMLITEIFILSLAALGECKEEPSKRIVYKPQVKHFTTIGKLEYLNSTNQHYRLLRDADECPIPLNRKDSQLDCFIFPNRKTCIQTCKFGHTLSDGIQREMKCVNAENQWEPVPNFEYCEPFVDCQVTLTDPGKIDCYTNYLVKGTECKISCKGFEDKPDVKSAIYKCNIEGKWSPKLPYCVKPGSGMNVVPPPKGIKKITEV